MEDTVTTVRVRRSAQRRLPRLDDLLPSSSLATADTVPAIPRAARYAQTLMIRHPPLRRRTSAVWWLLGCAMAIASLVLVATHARTQESIAQQLAAPPRIEIQFAPDEPVPDALEPALAPASMSLAEPVAPAKIAKRKRMPAKPRRTPARTRWNPDALFLPQR